MSAERPPRPATDRNRRGRLRVLLGAAPGVGKTFEMLAEGRRLRDEGRDVVIAIVETHGRAATAALTSGRTGSIMPTRPMKQSSCSRLEGSVFSGILCHSLSAAANTRRAFAAMA